MEIVIAALVGLLILAAVFWTGAIFSASSADRKAREAQAVETMREQKIVERERRMRGEAIALHCAACDLEFTGPLTDSGCPKCHSAALIVPEDEYRRIKAQGAFPGAGSEPHPGDDLLSEGNYENGASRKQQQHYR